EVADNIADSRAKGAANPGAEDAADPGAEIAGESAEGGSEAGGDSTCAAAHDRTDKSAGGAVEQGPAVGQASAADYRVSIGAASDCAVAGLEGVLAPALRGQRRAADADRGYADTATESRRPACSAGVAEFTVGERDQLAGAHDRKAWRH